MTDDQRRRYEAALHGMQAGVAYEMESGATNAHTPKHLRVGVNSAMVEHSALVHVLITAGIINEYDYFERLIAMMEQERASYETRASERTGKVVRFV